MSRFQVAGRVVVKVGSSSLTAADGRLDVEVVDAVAAQLAGIAARGWQPVLVSSGAVAAGLAPLGLPTRPTDLPGLQAAASVGQGALVGRYTEAFAGRGLAVGQVLLTPDDVVDRGRYLNARATVERLLSLGAVPVVNENDTVATDELRFGDNDRLAALVTSMLDARLLVLLSDVDGLYDRAPALSDARLLDRVDDVDALDRTAHGGAGSEVGTGGMASKVEAARIATFSGAHVVIAQARRPGVVAEVVGGGHVGTWFPPRPVAPGGRKRWIAFARRPRGRLRVDAGAVRALVERGSSLLPAGVVDVTGDFGPGDAVEVVDPLGGVVARGLVAHGSEAIRHIMGRSTADLDDGLARTVIHRDHMVVLARSPALGADAGQ